MFLNKKRKNCYLPEAKEQKKIVKEMTRAEKIKKEQQLHLLKMKETEEKKTAKEKRMRERGIVMA